MSMRLVELRDGKRRGATTLRGEMRIGRDAACDLACDYARVSRIHAVLRPRDDGRYTVYDAGSSNGTKLNGTPLGAEPVLLHEGDRLELADEVVFVLEAAPSGASPRAIAVGAGAALAVALLAALVALLVGRTGDDPVLDAARALAREAVAASEAGDAEAVKTKLRHAAGLLFKEGYLDDVPRHDALRVGIERIADGMDGAPPLFALFERALAEDAGTRTPAARGDDPQARATSTSASAAAPRPAAARGDRPPASARCALDRVDAPGLDGCIDEWVRVVLGELRQDPDGYPSRLPSQIARRMSVEYGVLERALERGRPIVPMLRRELEAARMPALLHYLALIESSYVTTAGSHAGAVGLWQFMPATARHYGLRVDAQIDERLDPGKSTRAAAHYLQDLAFEFSGSALLLALAGYNYGENGVQRALKKLDDPFSERSYWTLVDRSLIPEETRLYVTRFLTAAVAGEGGLPRAETLEAAGYRPVRR